MSTCLFVVNAILYVRLSHVVEKAFFQRLKRKAILLPESTRYDTGIMVIIGTDDITIIIHFYLHVNFPIGVRILFKIMHIQSSNSLFVSIPKKIDSNIHILNQAARMAW